jgi:DNA topoisomerase III
MKTLIIAEKPSVARDIAASLGRVKKKEDYFENEELVISCALGHLVELFMPEDIDKKLRYWRMESLPILPDRFQLKPIEKSQKQFALLKKLLARKDITNVVNACDAGREGELIFTYVYEACKCRKPVKRLWMQSMTADGIRTAWKSLREGEVMQPLQDAARSRSEADWLIGINGTRAITTRMYGSRRGQVATVGRVQTPTLAIVCEREKEIRNFQPRDFWRLKGQFKVAEGTYEGVYQKPDFKKSDDPHDRIDRLWEEARATAVLSSIADATHAEVSEEKKRTKQAAPRLYDLTSLQREANNRFGMPAGITLRSAQALYEKHKLLTYPRTDSRCLPEDYLGVCKETLGKLDGPFRPHAERALNEGYVKFDRKIFDNKKVSDHFAIIPTGTPAEDKKLTSDELKIYDMVTRRFIAAFYPAAEWDVTTRHSTVREHVFKTEGKVLAYPGWLDVYGKAGHGKDNLPPITPPDGQPPKARVLNTEMEKDTTKPPPRYTEATLLSAMEGAGKLVDDEDLADAMKEKGLGTPATRAQTIDHLIHERYIERDARFLVPTGKAEGLMEFLEAVKIESLVRADLTGEWEYRLKQVEEGRLSRKEFMKGIREHAQRIVDKTKNFSETTEDATETDIISPTDQKPLLEMLRAYKSQDGSLTIYKTIGNRKMEIDEVREILEKGQVGPLDGFRSKAGKAYSAILRLDEEKKVRFVFDNNGSGENAEGETPEELDLTRLRVIGKSPIDGSPIYETPSAFASESYLKGDKEKGIRISRNMLGRQIPTEEAEKLFREKKTGLIENFRSNRTKKLFSAFLTLKDDGKIGFEFPPRPPQKAVAKKTAPKS